jgi:hypothetical protein
MFEVTSLGFEIGNVNYRLGRNHATDIGVSERLRTLRAYQIMPCEGGLAMKPTLLVLGVLALGGCAIATQIATRQDAKKAAECTAEAQATPEAQLIFKRLWKFDSTDTADKLSDPKPLTPEERNALIQVHNRLEPCRQIIISHDN